MINSIEKNSPNILVIGDLIVDSYLWGNCNRVSPEAPVQIIDIKKNTNILGGAGNVVNNLKALNANVEIISIIGDCEISKELKKLFNQIGIGTKYLIEQKDRVTSKKTRLVSSNQQVIRFDIETVSNINKSSESAILSIYKSIINKFDLIILSDYGKGVLTEFITQEIIKTANQSNIRVIVDPKGKDFSKYSGAYLLTPNKNEVFEATGINIVDNKSLEKSLLFLKNKYNLEISLITLSEGGIGIYDKSYRTHPTLAKEIFDVTGAGDTVIASLGYALAVGQNIDNSAIFANLAAGVVVGKLGSGTASFSEIRNYESTIHSSTRNDVIKNINQITKILDHYRDKSIVFTNGCFDILHIGHVKYLEKAKELGDILIVGINSDNSVKKLKGEKRPINNLYDRSYILASLSFVDYVVPFDEETPIELIKEIIPDVLVKGGDYDIKDVVGKDIAKKTVLIDLIEGKSTSSTIKKIKEND